MGELSDIWVGFLKPFRDLAGSLLIYYLMTIRETIPSTIHNDNFAFNIGIFFAIFFFVSIFSELIVEMISNLKSGYKRPIDSFWRLCGLIFGIILLFFVLTPSYYYIGGEVGEVLFFEFVGACSSVVGILLRYFLNK